MKRLILAMTGAVALLAAVATPKFAAGEAVDPELVDRVAERVLQRLQQDGTLDEAIAAGIERFIEQRNQARERSRRDAEQLAQALPPYDPARNHLLGNPDAPLTLIEYSDFECPFCKRFHPTAHELVATNGGRVNWVYRHFPLRSHNPAAQREAEASECVAELAGNDAFWAFTDGVYAATASNGIGVPEELLGALADEAGTDEEAFIACLASGRHRARVLEDFESGQAAGVSGTPGNFLRDNRTGAVLVRNGALPVAQLQGDIDRLLP